MSLWKKKKYNEFLYDILRDEGSSDKQSQAKANIHKINQCSSDFRFVKKISRSIDLWEETNKIIRRLSSSLSFKCISFRIDVRKRDPEKSSTKSTHCCQTTQTAKIDRTRKIVQKFYIYEVRSYGL